MPFTQHERDTMSIQASKTKHATRAQRRHIAYLYGTYPTDTMSRHEASLLITSRKAANERVDILQKDADAWSVNAQAFIARKLAS